MLTFIIEEQQNPKSSKKRKSRQTSRVKKWHWGKEGSVWIYNIYLVCSDLIWSDLYDIYPWGYVRTCTHFLFQHMDNHSSINTLWQHDRRCLTISCLSNDDSCQIDISISMYVCIDYQLLQGIELRAIDDDAESIPWPRARKDLAAPCPPPPTAPRESIRLFWSRSNGANKLSLVFLSGLV